VTVYVDNMLRRATVGRIASEWSHLFADSTEELLAFGAQLGMRPEWLQHPGTHREHFDLIKTKRLRALGLGAEPIAYPHGTAALLERKRAATQDRP
jgi:hypothetical protein